ncbi:MAG: lipid-A-disaccharide synthase [Lewinella sp.]|nr:lipid-A-disaccharide synthase [Lewinella sp.]
MKYYLIAGEASGDLHGSYLIKALRRQDPEAQLRAWGGDLMQAAGADVVKHYRDLAFMGFVEVALNIRTILGNFRRCKEDVLRFQPDVLILIDYPGFNLRMAKWAHEQGIRVFYYISPQIWAWHTSRVKQIKAFVDRMFVILPFEQAFYAEYGQEVDYVGHPLLDVIDDFRPDPNFRSRFQLGNGELVALLPGSRRQEIDRMLEVMLSVARRFPDLTFVVAGAPSQEDAVYRDLFTRHEAPDNVKLIHQATYDLLHCAKAALVTSGTATLETALFGVPQVVCYRGGRLSYLIARRLVQVKYISLVNLIVDQALVPELIQDDLTPDQLSMTLDRIMDQPAQTAIESGYRHLRETLGQGGAAQQCAALMLHYLQAQ